MFRGSPIHLLISFLKAGSLRMFALNLAPNPFFSSQLSRKISTITQANKERVVQGNWAIMKSEKPWNYIHLFLLLFRPAFILQSEQTFAPSTPITQLTGAKHSIPTAMNIQSKVTSPPAIPAHTCLLVQGIPSGHCKCRQVSMTLVWEPLI